MQTIEGKRIVFGDFVDKIFWAVIVAITSYGVMQLQSLSANVAKLNENMAVVLFDLNSSHQRIDKLERRMDDFETTKQRQDF